MKKALVLSICSLCFLGGIAVWFVMRSDLVYSAPINEAGSHEVTDSYAGIASPELAPEEVVEKQVRSIREAVDSPERIRECFALASPGNREMTGPLERFAAMVLSEPYTSLAVAPKFQIGAALVEGEYAAVLVTAVSDAGLPAAFRFVLEKQALPPYEDCWMTVAVDVVEVESEVGIESTKLSQ